MMPVATMVRSRPVRCTAVLPSGTRTASSGTGPDVR